MNVIDTRYPDIFITDIEHNPTLCSPNADYELHFAMTKENSYDFDEFKEFIESAIREFRHSRTYSHYKAYLISRGLNCCQFHPYIQNASEDEKMATIEMHHCMLNIYDIATLIAQHYLNTIGQLTEFDLSEALRYEHIHNRIPITMLCKSCHQLYHHKYLYVHPDMIFGKWWELFQAYPLGLTRDIAYKVLMYLNKCISEDKLQKQTERNAILLQLHSQLMNWANSGCSVRY